MVSFNFFNTLKNAASQQAPSQELTNGIKDINTSGGQW